MSHQDLIVSCNAQCLKRALQWLFAGIAWSGIKFRRDCTWTPRALAWAALLWAWSDESTLLERFQSVRRILQFLLPQQGDLATSYQAFIKLLVRWTVPLMGLLQAALRQRMQAVLPAAWKFDGWLLFGVDGSRVELPRTRSHEAVYSAARKEKKAAKRRRISRQHAKKANSPQMWITTMWHAGTGLPWDWRTGPADSSERAHLLEMLPTLPAAAMVAADAGFVGYTYLQAILDSERHFLIRVGANVRLLRKLGYARESSDTVYLWPDRQARHASPPLVLRLVVVHNGKHPVYLLTSVRSARELSAAQVALLYRKRWGIEVFYRHLKQTYNRRKLRSLTAENARVEMQWAIAGLWAMALYALVELQAAGIAPSRLSMAGTLRAFRRLLRDYRHPRERGSRLHERLQKAVIDSYQRKNKTSRDYPRKKKEKPPGKPCLTQATPFQIRQAKTLKNNRIKKRLTA